MFTPLNDFYITLPELPDHAEVQAYAANPTHLAGEEQTPPRWAVLCLLVGSFLLVVSGLAFSVLLAVTP